MRDDRADPCHGTDRVGALGQRERAVSAAPAVSGSRVQPLVHDECSELDGLIASWVEPRGFGVDYQPGTLGRGKRLSAQA